MKQRFIAGLIILLPIVVTWWLASLVISIATQPFQSLTKSWLHTLGLFQNGLGYGLLSEQQVVSAFSTIFILISLFVVICLIGMLGEWFFIRSFLSLFDRFLLAMPLVRKIYKSCKDFTKILFSDEQKRFSKVVWVPFPHGNNSILGLVTNEISLPSENNKKYVSVLIPGTPNPTVGFLLFFPKEQVEETDIPVDEGMKWVISCGSAHTPALLRSISAKVPIADGQDPLAPF